MLIKNNDGIVIGCTVPHETSVQARIQHPLIWRATGWHRLGYLSCRLAEFGGLRWRSWMFALYRWAENKSEILSMPPALTTQQKLDNCAARTEYFAALSHEEEGE